MRIDLALSKIKNNSCTFVKYVFILFPLFMVLRGLYLCTWGINKLKNRIPSPQRKFYKGPISFKNLSKV